jgi:hypothetical protein
MFSPSHLDGDGTTASADFCRLNQTSQPGLPVFFSAWRQISPGKSVDFPCAPASFTASALGRFGLRCFLPSRPASQPHEIRVPPVAGLPSASFRRHFAMMPLPSASGWCDLLRKGLSPSSQRPCWAHKKGDRSASPVAILLLGAATTGHYPHSFLSERTAVKLGETKLKSGRHQKQR